MFASASNMIYELVRKGMADPQPTSGIQSMLFSKQSTKDVIGKYHESVQHLTDAIYQLQKEVRNLNESSTADHGQQEDAMQGMQATVKELSLLSGHTSLRLDMQQMFDDVIEAIDSLRDVQSDAIEEMKKQVYVPERKTSGYRRAGLIEGVFRGIDQLLLQGFAKAAHHNCIEYII